nr:MAG: movement protein [Piper chlorosis virus]
MGHDRMESEKPKISEFVNLNLLERFVPTVFTRVKYVKISNVDKILVNKSDTLCDVDLLSGVKLIDNGYVCLAGLVVTGEWNLPDNCGGGVSVCLVDKRMKESREATLGSYYNSAAGKRFSFKLIPNYSVTTNDARRNPWQVMVNIRNVKIEPGWCPLTLEFVSVCITHSNNVTKGLRAKITRVIDGTSLELNDGVLDEFIESVPMASRLSNLRLTESIRVVNKFEQGKIPRKNKNSKNEKSNKFGKSSYIDTRATDEYSDISDTSMTRDTDNLGLNRRMRFGRFRYNNDDDVDDYSQASTGS